MEQNSPSDLLPIKVFGVGGAGCNCLEHLAADAGGNITAYALNTDAQALEGTRADHKYVLGKKISRGMGAGGDPKMGRAAADADAVELRSIVDGAKIVFILAGMGGGTGTGAAPVIARLAREKGALVIGVVTLPFSFEGTRRISQAEAGLQELKSAADCVICLPNQSVLKLVDEKATVPEAFQKANNLVGEGVRGICRLLLQRGLINVDFSDVCSVTQGRHSQSYCATATAEGSTRASQVVEQMLTHPLLDGGKILSNSATVLVSIAGGPDLTLREVQQVMDQITQRCEKAITTMGAVIDPRETGRLSLTLIASCQEATIPAPRKEEEDMQFVVPNDSPNRIDQRFIPPAPELADRTKEDLFKMQGRRGGSRKKGPYLFQTQLPLEVVSRGRFEKSEPTLHAGQDLDIPTFVRQGILLN